MFSRLGLEKLNWEAVERPLLVVFGALVLSSALLNLEFQSLESRFYDLRMSQGLQATPSDEIVLITLDDRAAKLRDELLPLSLNDHAEIIQRLSALKPKAIGYLVDFSAVQQNNPETYSSLAETFAKTVRQLQADGTIFRIGTPYDVTGEVVPPFPLGTLPHAVAVVHKDGNVFSEDKVTRRAVLRLNNAPAFQLALAQDLGRVSQTFSPRGSYTLSEVESEYFFFRYHSNPANTEQEQSYARYSAADLLLGKLDSTTFQNKIVLVGTVSKDDSSDFAYTPYSRQLFATSKLAVHATILDSLLHNDGLVRAPRWLNLAVTFVVIAFVIWSVLNTTPLYGVFSSLTLALFFTLVAQLVFQTRGLWIRMSEPLVGIFVSYYLVVPYRLIREYKQRWDYQRKNELLTQVEELKTNFLQLVTHDLKTPVARIQGLAEVLLRRIEESSARQTLSQIVYSTEELNRFISSILELSKVESHNIKLYYESKDINQLIERVTSSFEAQARAKEIKLVLELEPLFPIRLDPSLMTKVLANVIDNAIKYSPLQSTISIRTEEVDGYVKISISDQGIGLSNEELENLFTRFYRAKNDATTVNPGTGLGLYLTKYFVERHNGRVNVVSNQAEGTRGTTFNIFLPLETTISGTSGLTIARPETLPPATKENPHV